MEGRLQCLFPTFKTIVHYVLRVSLDNKSVSPVKKAKIFLLHTAQDIAQMNKKQSKMFMKFLSVGFEKKYSEHLHNFLDGISLDNI